MLRRYSFLVLFMGLLSTLAWWSGHVESSTAPAEPAFLSSDDGAETAQRREAIEALDRIVAYEHYYRSVYGHFTRLISRLGYRLPAGLSELYDVRVTEASGERLVVTAFSEVEGKPRDRVSVDQDFRVRASFPVPQPSSEYLRTLALKQLRELRVGSTGEQVVLEQSVFRGYFRYDVKRDLQDRKIGVAVGIKAPVLGMQVEFGRDQQDLAAEEVFPLTGQKPVVNVMSTLEEAYLAQKIFRGEVGRYAKSWTELSKITRFRFDDKEKYGSEADVPFGDTGSVHETEVASVDEIDQSNRDLSRQPSSESKPLEIEPIFSDEKK
jgi:hypothetical protein